MTAFIGKPELPADIAAALKEAVRTVPSPAGLELADDPQAAWRAQEELHETAAGLLALAINNAVAARDAEIARLRTELDGLRIALASATADATRLQGRADRLLQGLDAKHQALDALRTENEALAVDCKRHLRDFKRERAYAVELQHRMQRAASLYTECELALREAQPDDPNLSLPHFIDACRWAAATVKRAAADVVGAEARGRAAGRAEALERARHLSIGEGVRDATPIEQALQLYREETMEWESCDHPSGAANDAERRQLDAYLALFAAIDDDKQQAVTAAEQRGREAGRAEVLPALTAERDAAVDALSVAIRERDAAVEALATAPELEVALEDGGDTHYEAGFIDAGGEPTGHARDREAADTTLRAAIAKHTNSAVERARAQMAREECVACSGQPESCNAASCITGAVLAGASPEQLHAIATAPRREPPAVAILAELAGKPSP